MASTVEPLVVEINDSKEYQRVLDGTSQTHGMKVGKVYLEPGGSCGEHTTGGREEALVFLSGTGRMLIGKEENAYDVGAGRVSYIPPETVHDIENTGDEPLIYIFCVAPARPAPE